MSPLTICAAIIERDKQVLIAKRPFHKTLGGKWEFPGGKLEAGESYEQCLVRELQEEINIVIQVGKFLFEVSCEDAGPGARLRAYHCQLVSGEPSCAEHLELRWASYDKLLEYDWPKADYPIIQALLAER